MTNGAGFSIEERSRQNNRLTEIRRIIQPEAQIPLELWYYTSGTTLIKILESKEIWSTQISCLNDAEEYSYALKMLRTSFAEVRSLPVNANRGYLIDRIVSDMYFDHREVSFLFVTCFSSAPDDLSQWRAYGGGEGGYAIGFSSAQLRQFAVFNQGVLEPVCYSIDLQKEYFRQLAEISLDEFDACRSVRAYLDDEAYYSWFWSEWLKDISWAAALIKHPSFEKEQEWRIVRGFSPNEFGKLKFLQKNTMMSRHLPLYAHAITGERMHLPISSVYIGPGRHKITSGVSVDSLLKGSGHSGVAIYYSQVPFQSA